MGNGENLMSSTVKVHYRGTLLNGKEFDSSYACKEPILSHCGVIKGWTEGLQYMPVGSNFKFYIPNLAMAKEVAGLYWSLRNTHF